MERNGVYSVKFGYRLSMKMLGRSIRQVQNQRRKMVLGLVYGSSKFLGR